MTLTLKEIPQDLDHALRQRAEEQNKPVDQVAVDAMKTGLGIGMHKLNVQPTENLAASIHARFAPLYGMDSDLTVHSDTVTIP